MPIFGTLLALAALVTNVAAHYKFQQLSTSGTKYEPWQYIRRNSNPDWLQNGPVVDLDSTDLRCNVGGEVSNGTETVAMKAGDEFTFNMDTAVYHQGPVSL
ncbi:hypothetical protein IMZ48_30220 [Candidatus Bathyarchaeota archaeon]|nr:hypothetical protein [Candidatus Bathyarchaeota archaeon]